MTPIRLILIFLLLPFLLAGCSEEERPDPTADSMGFGFEEVKYQGARRGDDNDLYARYEHPGEKGDNWIFLTSDRNPQNRGGIYGCLAREPEWKDKWWLEISLYEEIDGEFIGRERWIVDCVQYWIAIDEDANMELHEGTPPRLRDEPRIPGFTVTAALVGLGVVAWTRLRR